MPDYRSSRTTVPHFCWYTNISSRDRVRGMHRCGPLAAACDAAGVATCHCCSPNSSPFGNGPPLCTKLQRLAPMHGPCRALRPALARCHLLRSCSASQTIWLITSFHSASFASLLPAVAARGRDTCSSRSAGCMRPRTCSCFVAPSLALQKHFGGLGTAARRHARLHGFLEVLKLEALACDSMSTLNIRSRADEL